MHSAPHFLQARLHQEAGPFFISGTPQTTTERRRMTKRPRRGPSPRNGKNNSNFRGSPKRAVLCFYIQTISERKEYMRTKYKRFFRKATSSLLAMAMTLSLFAGIGAFGPGVAYAAGGCKPEQACAPGACPAPDPGSLSARAESNQRHAQGKGDFDFPLPLRIPSP